MFVPALSEKRWRGYGGDDSGTGDREGKLLTSVNTASPSIGSWEQVVSVPLLPSVRTVPTGTRR